MKQRSPLTIGWEAARANALPALVIQTMMLGLLVAYYTNQNAAWALGQTVAQPRTAGLDSEIRQALMEALEDKDGDVRTEANSSPEALDLST